MRGGGFPGRAAQVLSLLLYSPAQDGKHIKCFPLRAELATNFMPSGPPREPPLSYPPAFRKSKCQKIRFFDSVLYNPPFVGTIQRVRKQKGLIRVV